MNEFGFIEDDELNFIDDNNFGFVEELPEYKRMTFKEFLQATPEEAEENLKALGRKQIQERQDWEQKHPVISGIQKDWQPNYRAGLVEMQDRAKYGFTPLNKIAQSEIKKAGYNLIPTINLGTALLTRGLGNKGTLLQMAKGQAGQGGIQGAVEGFLGGLADTGSLPQALKRGLTGAGIGVAAGVAQPLGTKVLLNSAPGVREEVVKEVIKPKSIALDMTKEQAERLAQDTTQRFKDAYQTMMTKAGDKVNAAIRNLKNNTQNTSVNDLKNDIKAIFDSYQLGQSNRMRELTGNLEKELMDSIDNKIIPNQTTRELSPLSLQGEKLKIRDMTDWDNAKAKNKNQILEQVYGKFNDRISAMSPELAQANKEYADLASYMGQKSRVRDVLNNNVKLSTSTSALKNYKNIDDSLLELEKKLIQEGNEPFLDAIDQANLANELVESIKTGFNPSGLTDKAKELLSRPGLNFARGLNRFNENLPENIKQVGEYLPEVLRRAGIAAGINYAKPRLQGGIEYNEY